MSTTTTEISAEAAEQLARLVPFDVLVTILRRSSDLAVGER